MRKYNPSGKTIGQVIADTNKIKNRHLVSRDSIRGKMYYFKKYNDCTSIVTANNKYYVSELYDLYGPFALEDCTQFRKILHIHTESHQQAMVNSW